MQTATWQKARPTTRMPPPSRAPVPFAPAWRATDQTLRALRRPVLARVLNDKFQQHTITLLSEMADDRVQDAAAMFANSCLSTVPVVNQFPVLRQLGQELAKRLAGEMSTKSVVSDLVQRCGKRNAGILLAFSLVTFMLHLAQTWGADGLSFVDVAQLLYSHLGLAAAFVSGKDVDLAPLVSKLAPHRGGNVDAIWDMLRDNKVKVKVCKWCRHHCV